MNKYIYIQKDTKSIYVEFDSLLDESYGTGDTWESYAEGAWVLLTAGQLAFRGAHPHASVQEVFNMELIPAPDPLPEPERALREAIKAKIFAIDVYDNTEVNRFVFKMGEEEIPVWFDAPQRATYQTSIGARRKLIAAGLETEAAIRLPIAGRVAVLPLDSAELMLARLQKYADDAYNVTYMHRVTVEQLTEIEEVDAYDYTAGYPERLTFEI